jgi:hypothetical protein
MSLTDTNAAVWLHNLHIVLGRPSAGAQQAHWAEASVAVVALSEAGTRLWMTSVSMYGSGRSCNEISHVPLRMEEGTRAYLQGACMADCACPLRSTS